MIWLSLSHTYTHIYTNVYARTVHTCAQNLHENKAHKLSGGELITIIMKIGADKLMYTTQKRVCVCVYM